MYNVTSTAEHTQIKHLCVLERVCLDPAMSCTPQKLHGALLAHVDACCYGQLQAGCQTVVVEALTQQHNH
jgi:hypothetical protein